MQVFFLWILQNFWDHLFWTTSVNNCFYIFIIILIIIITVITFTIIVKWTFIIYKFFEPFLLIVIWSPVCSSIYISLVLFLAFCFLCTVFFYDSEFFYDHQTTLTCSLYTYIYIYSYLHLLAYTYLNLLIYSYVFFIPLYKLIKVITKNVSQLMRFQYSLIINISLIDSYLTLIFGM